MNETVLYFPYFTIIPPTFENFPNISPCIEAQCYCVGLPSAAGLARHKEKMKVSVTQAYVMEYGINQISFWGANIL